MQRFVVSALIVALLAAASSAAPAASYYFHPGSPSLKTLNHQYAYYWGIGFSLPADEQIVSVSLTFDDIYNTKSAPNELFVSLLDNKPGKSFTRHKTYRDRKAGPADYFDSWKWGETDLVNYSNLSTTPADLTYFFTPAQIGILETYLSDGRFGIGIDPDCRFRDHGITLTINTVIPGSGGGGGSGGTGDDGGGSGGNIAASEPPAALLLLAGLVAAVGAGFLRRIKLLRE
jgi:hypothetical protein